MQKLDCLSPPTCNWCLFGSPVPLTVSVNGGFVTYSATSDTPSYSTD